MKKCLLVGDVVSVRWHSSWRGLVGRTFVIVGSDEFRDSFLLRDLNDDSYSVTVRRDFVSPVTSKIVGVCNG